MLKATRPGKALWFGNPARKSVCSQSTIGLPRGSRAKTKASGGTNPSHVRLSEVRIKRFAHAFSWSRVSCLCCFDLVLSNGRFPSPGTFVFPSSAFRSITWLGRNSHTRSKDVFACFISVRVLPVCSSWERTDSARRLRWMAFRHGFQTTVGHVFHVVPSTLVASWDGCAKRPAFVPNRRRTFLLASCRHRWWQTLG